MISCYDIRLSSVPAPPEIPGKHVHSKLTEIRRTANLRCSSTGEKVAGISTQRVTEVHHWNETLFSFKTTRDPSLRFENGHFVMLGIEVEGKPLMRAYSIASPNYDEELEFFSIKVPDGPLTSRLQNIRVGDQVLVSNKPTGTLVVDHLLEGRHLYLISTGTGLGPIHEHHSGSRNL